jgi:hypothetical protein
MESGNVPNRRFPEADTVARSTTAHGGMVTHMQTSPNGTIDPLATYAMAANRIADHSNAVNHDFFNPSPTYLSNPAEGVLSKWHPVSSMLFPPENQMEEPVAKEPYFYNIPLQNSSVSSVLPFDPDAFANIRRLGSDTTSQSMPYSQSVASQTTEATSFPATSAEKDECTCLRSILYGVEYSKSGEYFCLSCYKTLPTLSESELSTCVYSSTVVMRSTGVMLVLLPSGDCAPNVARLSK